MQNNVNTNISWYEGHNYQKFGQKLKFSKFYVQNIWQVSEAMTSSTHSFAYSYGLVKKCFLKICETWKCHNFLICQPIFIRFSLFCSENFTLSSEIKLDQLRTSPLKTLWIAATCHRPFFCFPYVATLGRFDCTYVLPKFIFIKSFKIFWHVLLRQYQLKFTQIKSLTLGNLYIDYNLELGFQYFWGICIFYLKCGS